MGLVPGLLNFSTEIPFYIRGNQPTSQLDALTAGEEDANWKRQVTSSSEDQQSSSADVQIQLIYKVKSGSTLAKEKFLILMDEIEDKIQSKSGYNDVCMRLYTGGGINQTIGYKCSRPNTITNFFNESFFLPSIDQSYTIYPSFTNFAKFVIPSLLIDGSVELENKNYSEAFINDILLYWAGYDQGDGPSGDYIQKYYNGQPMPGRLNLSVATVI